MQPSVLVEVKNVHKDYPLKRKSLFKKPEVVKAVRGVSFSLLEHETFGCVGESGCGKSTFSRLLIMLEKPTKGNVLYRNENIHGTKKSKMMKLREKGTVGAARPVPVTSILDKGGRYYPRSIEYT